MRLSLWLKPAGIPLVWAKFKNENELAVGRWSIHAPKQSFTYPGPFFTPVSMVVRAIR
jgi:hypothetical protein